MNKLKKLIPLILVISIILVIITPVVAESQLDNANTNSEASFVYTKEAVALNQLGLFAGTSTESFKPDLGLSLTREQAVTLLLRLFGEDQNALRMTSEEADNVLGMFTDKNEVSSWARKFVAYVAVTKTVVGYISGTERTFKPQQIVSGEEYCAMLAKKMEYTSFKFGDVQDGAVQAISKANGLTADEAAVFFAKSALTRDDFVGISFKVLKATIPNGVSVLEKLSETKTEEQRTEFINKLKAFALIMPEVAREIIHAIQEVEPKINIVEP